MQHNAVRKCTHRNNPRDLRQSVRMWNRYNAHNPLKCSDFIGLEFLSQATIDRNLFQNHLV